MRHWGALLLAPALLVAQTAPVRGVLLERDPQASGGQFSVRLPSFEVLRFRFDAQTKVERDGHVIDVPRLKPGEKVEVVGDPISGLMLRQARSVSVTIDPSAPPPPPPLRPSRLAQLRSANRYAEDRSLPTGNLTYAGVVARFGADRIVLHTRDGKEQSLLLRKDTRYLLNGDLVDAALLKLNTPVFVRAGRDLWDQVEAYQVIWGKILAP
jgi:hypothetical protein